MGLLSYLPGGVWEEEYSFGFGVRMDGRLFDTLFRREKVQTRVKQELFFLCSMYFVLLVARSCFMLLLW